MESEHTGESLLRVRGLKTYFRAASSLMSRSQGYIHAVDDVSLDVFPGETVGLVGESGCGKSTFAQTCMRIVPATSGSVVFDGKDVLSLNSKELRALRRDMQLIFQDPYSSLNPRMKVGHIVSEPLHVMGIRNEAERKRRVLEVFEDVGLEEAHYNRYPHEFSGGQRQRISIARSLILRPKLIFCDEPVSALDVSIQSQILNLIKDLQKQYKLTLIFISHALNVIRHMSDRIVVMYLGKIVEIAPAEDIFEKAVHPYTMALLSAIPIPDPTLSRQRIILKGDIPSAKNPPKGCRFHTRCPYAEEICSTQAPELKEVSPGHKVACHFFDAQRNLAKQVYSWQDSRSEIQLGMQH